METAKRRNKSKESRQFNTNRYWKKKKQKSQVPTAPDAESEGEFHLPNDFSSFFNPNFSKSPPKTLENEPWFLVDSSWCRFLSLVRPLQLSHIRRLMRDFLNRGSRYFPAHFNNSQLQNRTEPESLRPGSLIGQTERRGWSVLVWVPILVNIKEKKLFYVDTWKYFKRTRAALNFNDVARLSISLAYTCSVIPFISLKCLVDFGNLHNPPIVHIFRIILKIRKIIMHCNFEHEKYVMGWG